ncbi:hypothetical protein [Aestuariibacter salexigens]|uniref:hypothetical protein n=1 Tax=Aestuariibacter salexigens TaxID=226010 RepID=UPI00047B1B44|nr:hypothetical protein [Aestuariibacter salexigens]
MNSRNLQLNHPHTPDTLRTLNSELLSLLDADVLDEAKLLAVVTERDDFIKTYLAAVDDVECKDFVKCELITNKKITEVVCSLRKESLSKIYDLIKGRKAVEKYKKKNVE